MNATHPTRLIAALDTADEATASAWAAALAPHVHAIKFGLEFAYAQGFGAIKRVSTGHSLFLDLKLHDIPNTVASAVKALAELAPSMLSLHAQGGQAMIEAARVARDTVFAEQARPLLLAVTVLTSLDAKALHETGVAGGPRQQVLRLAALAMNAGADGLVCSPHEIGPLRDLLGDRPVLVVPGIRPAGETDDDQKRVMTPRAAHRAGADWIVVGRPITRAADPAAAAAAIAADLLS